MPVPRRLMCVAMGVSLGACYLNTPIDTSVAPPVAGDRVALSITDQGRVSLSERFGAGVNEIEGQLTAVSPTAFEMRVFKVGFARDAASQWSGERVTIDRSAVGQVFTRTLSRRRTTIAASAVTAGLIAFIITRELITGGRDRDPSGQLPGPDQLRLPRLHTP